MDPTRPGKQVVIRSGGLGDFLVTLPLLRALATRGPLLLITRPAYARLVADDALFSLYLSIDDARVAAWIGGDAQALQGLLHDACVYSFLPGLSAAAAAAGAYGLVPLEARPTGDRHVTARMFAPARLPWSTRNLRVSHLARPQAPRQPCLWVHPGSGSPAKNLPLADYARLIASWLDTQQDAAPEVIVSFGEADMPLLPAARRQFAGLPVLYRVQPTLPELRQDLSARATQYLGGDTGVTHLAAALDIPTTVVYLQPNAALWLPVGAQVRAREPETLRTAADLLAPRPGL